MKRICKLVENGNITQCETRIYGNGWSGVHVPAMHLPVVALLLLPLRVFPRNVS